MNTARFKISQNFKLNSRPVSPNYLRDFSWAYFFGHKSKTMRLKIKKYGFGTNEKSMKIGQIDLH